MYGDVKLEAEASFHPSNFISIHPPPRLAQYILGASMASRATYIAFGSIAKRGLTTATPTRYCPQQRLLNLSPPHHTLVSKASKGKKLPKNHFTSNRPASAAQEQHANETKKQEKGPKRKAAQRTQASSTSLRRVAVEAQRSRGSLIRGKGKTRHVDPEAETKDVTAYCAAETYNVHIARDLLKKDGWETDPGDTGLFPQVLHVQTKLAQIAKEGREEGGDVFVFPSGSVVTWNVSERLAHHLVEKVLLPAAENSHPDKLEAEDLEYIEDPSRESSEIIGDTIILGTKDIDTHDSTPSSDHHNHNQSQPETDTILAKIAFSSALSRSTKLAVLENALTSYFTTTRSIPTLLSQGRKPRFTRAFILRKTGELLHIRAQLNLYSELTDSLPDIFWDSPHELGLENYYESLGRELDVGQRIRVLNEKMDYASEIASVLRERLEEKHSHLLEWIIIWLIMVEVVYGSVHLWRERQERLDPTSNSNLTREYLLRELEEKERR